MKNPMRSARLSYKQIENETIILDTKVNKEVHQLNEVASFIWNQCDGKNTKEAIVDALCDEFEVDKITAEQDVQEILNSFLNKRLLDSDQS